MDTFTTGQTAGMTGIPIKTMQRYIKIYPEAFSETARQPDRGRRFNPQDIKALFLIRHLHQERTGPERIRQAITGEWTPDAAPWFDIEDALTIAKNTRADIRKAGLHAREALWAKENLDRDMSWFQTELKRLRQDYKKIDRELRDLKLRVMGLVHR